MAQRHGFQDNPELDGSKAISSGGLVLGLGVNVWVTHVLLTLVSGSATPAQHVVGAVALLCLLLGAFARTTARSVGHEARIGAARWLLLCVYPACLGLALSLQSEQVRETAYTALSMPLCAGSLLAYGAAAVLACQKTPQLLETETHPLNGRDSLAPGNPGNPGDLLRRVVVGLVLGGAFAITVVAPLVVPYDEAAKAWGDAAQAGMVFTALVASAVGVTVVAVHLGTALRRSERAAKRKERVQTLLFLVLLGFVTYLTVR